MKKFFLLIFFAAILSGISIAQTAADSLFDDFEDGDTLSMWGGPWTYFKDADPSTNIFAEVTGLEGNNGSGFSFHVTGQFKSFGGGVGLFDTAQGPHDLQGIFSGISFAAKGDTVPVRVRVREKKAESQRGYAYFGKIFTPTSEWTVYTIPFDSMTPQYGDPIPPFDATDLYAIDWGPAFVDQSIDIFVDGVYFTKATAVGINEKSVEPRTFLLKQNFPNPFNPSTVISWELPVSSHVTLKIYDILGNEIKTLINKKLTPGSHEIEFNAGNLPSGIYFYSLSAGNSHQTKKMILLR